jgi:phosphate transport system permease protein
MNSAEKPGPAENGYTQNLNKRHRFGRFWRVVFMASTIVGIVALTALLFNIINSAFGYVAVQNSNRPEDLVLSVQEERLLSAQNLVSSENDEVLAQGVAEDPYAIGFFGSAYYQQRADELRALAVDGVSPAADSVESGDYKLARPLFVYSTAEILQRKPQVADFINYYLTHVNEEIVDVGYFPASDAAISGSMLAWLDAVGMGAGGAETVRWPEVEPTQVTGEIASAGSSTVFPLSTRMAERFEAAGFTGDISIDSIGSTAGFRRFCADGDTDIANASRPIKLAEAELCKKNKRDPIEFRTGTDALSVVVSQRNDFLTEVTTDQLRDIFTTAEKWSDVDPSWPDELIVRYVPGADSGTLDFFMETVFDQDPKELPKEALVAILQANVSAGLFRRFENDQPFEDRSQENVYELVLERVVEPQVVATWSLYDSILNRGDVFAEAAEEHPDADVNFTSWINTRFITSPQSSEPEKAGVRTAILGSLWTIFITFLFAFPMGVGAAIYLEEYAADTWINRLIQTNINNLAGVPSIIYGMLGLALLVRALQPLTSGTLFGLADPTTANGRTILAAGITLGLLILPLIIINAQEAIRAVPSSLRLASYGMGATKWQTVWNHVLPSALPGILTGTILAISRAIGETAPLVVVGASTFITVDPTSPFSKFTTLPIQIYQWTARPQGEFRNIAAAAIIVLLALLLTLNATAVLLRNRYARRW